MVDPNRDKLRSLYNIEAEYQKINALIDELPDGSPADFGSEIYRSKDGSYYAVVTSKKPLPNDALVITCLNGYMFPEEYEIFAEYVPLEPSRPIEGFRVYRLDPIIKDGNPAPIVN